MSIAGFRWPAEGVPQMPAETAPVYRALIDPTRRSPTIVSRAVAKAAGIVVFRRRPGEGRVVVWSHARATRGIAIVRAEGFERLAIVAISNALTRRAGADVVLGPDCTEPIRMPSVIVAPGLPRAQ